MTSWLGAWVFCYPLRVTGQCLVTSLFMCDSNAKDIVENSRGTLMLHICRVHVTVKGNCPLARFKCRSSST
jgi:hypothetical protein